MPTVQKFFKNDIFDASKCVILKRNKLKNKKNPIVVKDIFAGILRKPL